MPNYRVDQGDKGELTLRSGSWQWFPISIVALPEGAVVSQKLVFAHRDHLGDAMWIRVPAPTPTLTEDAVRELALQGNERRLVTPHGEYTFETLDEPGWLRVRSRTRVFRVEIDNEQELAQLTHEELEELVWGIST
jgi:hypothetical protein